MPNADSVRGPKRLPKNITLTYNELYGESNVPPNRYNRPHKGYKHSMRTYVWVTLLVTGVMAALWFLLGVVPNGGGTVPPSFQYGAADMYFHSIAIGIASLLVYFVIIAFDIDKYEPNIDFPIAYRAMLATIIGAVGAFFYLTPVFNAAFEPITEMIIFVALLLLADVGGALLVQLYLLPAKLSGRYKPNDNVMGMFPRISNLPTFSDMKKMDSAYWLVITAVAVAFIAGIIGFIALWVNPYDTFIAVPTMFNGYISWIGGASAFVTYLVGSHSHAIGMAIILGVVAVVAKRYGVLDMRGKARSVAKFGMWVSIIGLSVMMVVYLLEAFTTVWPGSVPPNILASSSGGSIHLVSSTAPNGMAGDDSTMFLASLGAIIMLVPLMLTKLRGKTAWRDPVRMAILCTWIFAYIATPIEGFFIEFHEATLSGTPLDIVFGNLQYFALFGITMVALALLSVDFFSTESRDKKIIAVSSILIVAFTLVSGFIYAFYDPGALNAGGSVAGITAWGVVFSVGLLLISVIMVAAMLMVRSGNRHPIVHKPMAHVNG